MSCRHAMPSYTSQLFVISTWSLGVSAKLDTEGLRGHIVDNTIFPLRSHREAGGLCCHEHGNR